MPTDLKRTALDGDLPVEAPQVPHVGMTVGGRYRLLARRGRGGIGEVWEARQTATGRPAAIKLLLPGWQTDENVRRRFIREGRLASTMQHRHIVDILEVGESRGGQPFIAMELLPGPSLDVVMQQEGPLPWERVQRILLQVCGALDHAHGLKIVHRDVKPSNIMLCNRSGQRDRCKLVDFGIAKQRLVHLQTQQLTGEGQMLGSPGFMSPEQLQGRPTGVPSDIYGLGCTGFYLLMGQVPFAGRSLPEMIHNALYGTPRPLEGLDLPENLRHDIEAVFRRAVHRDPQERFGSILDFVVAINHVGTEISGAWTNAKPTSEYPVISAERSPAPPNRLPPSDATARPERVDAPPRLTRPAPPARAERADASPRPTRPDPPARADRADASPRLGRADASDRAERSAAEAPSDASPSKNDGSAASSGSSWSASDIPTQKAVPSTTEASASPVRRGVISAQSRGRVLIGRSTADTVGWSGPDGFVDLARVPPDIIVVHMSGQIGAKAAWLFEQQLGSLLQRHRPAHLFWHLGTLISYPSEVRDAVLRCLTDHRDCIESVHVLNSPGLVGMSVSLAAVAMGSKPSVYEDQVAWRMALDTCAFRRR